MEPVSVVSAALVMDRACSLSAPTHCVAAPAGTLRVLHCRLKESPQYVLSRALD